MKNVSQSEMDELEFGLNDNRKYVNDNVHDIFVNTCRVKGTATKGIPCVVKVFGQGEGTVCSPKIWTGWPGKYNIEY